jgi:hypothetical protein
MNAISNSSSSPELTWSFECDRNGPTALIDIAAEMRLEFEILILRIDVLPIAVAGKLISAGVAKISGLSVSVGVGWHASASADSEKSVVRRHAMVTTSYFALIVENVCGCLSVDCRGK